MEATLTRTPTLDTVLGPVQRDLSAVSDALVGELSDPVAIRILYLVTAGGKRLRPALVLLAGRSGGSTDRDALIHAAAAAEMIHTATLIHDDIIDGSKTRRRQPTFHRRWGTERAVLTGDYLYASAFTVLARLQKPDPLRIMAEVCQQLSRGELLEVEARFRLDLTVQEYLTIIRDKTASLIAGCCRMGAVLGGVAHDVADRLEAFGWNFGLAFQIVDDCLDLTGDPRRLGKSILADLDKGALSLPIIYLSQGLTARERTKLFAPLKTHATDPAFVKRVAQAARAQGAIRRALEEARQYMRQAQESVHQADLNGLAQTYEDLAAYAVKRTQ